MLFLLLFYGLVLGVTHYFSEKVNIKGVNRMRMVSFTAGILITYLFLHMFPVLFESDIILNRISLVFVLVGFAVFHALEKHIYQHSKSTEVLKKELKETHTISLFAYYMVMGMALVNIGRYTGMLNVTLFFVPLLLHAALSSISFSELHSMVRDRPEIKFLLSISTILGMLVAYYTGVFQAIQHMLMGSVIGMLLYITIVDSVPKEREGSPVSFLLGVAIYAVIIGFLWTL